MTQDLAGKHAIVTGGGTGIGLAIAQDLAAAGAVVTITGRRLDVLQTAAKSHANLRPAVMDVCDEQNVIDTIAAAVAEHGPIAICVANAGIAEGRAVHKTDLDFWRNIMTTNLDGAFLTIRECLKSMRGLEWGRVIAISSIAGLRGLKGAAAYSASKHGVIGLVRSLSADYMGSGLTFNAICPGYVQTAIIDQNVKSIKARAGVSDDEAMAMMVQANPHNRLIAPAEVSAAAMWVCGPNSGSINGQTIEVAGGQV